MAKLVVCALIGFGFLVSGQQEAKQESKEEVNLKGIKCIMMPKRDVSAKQMVETKEGKVYLCCGRCKAGFETAYKKDPSKFAAKANHQMVATGQYVQKGCPFSGGEVSDEHVATVGGVEVKFCCGGCAGKVNGAEDDAKKAEMVFTAKAFKTGFKRVKAEEKKEDK